MQTEKKAKALSVIIVSKAINDELKDMTQQAIDTCLLGGVDMEIIVIESNFKVIYKNAKTIHKYAYNFNYNAALNLGAKYSKGQYLAFCNNDLIFSKNWALNIINKMEKEGCYSGSVNSNNYHTDMIGWKVGFTFTGWCFVWKKELYDKIGLNEKYSYWCADNIVAKECSLNNYRNIRVKDSIVKHLNNQTGKTVKKEVFKQMTWGNAKRYAEEEKTDLFPKEIVKINLR